MKYILGIDLGTSYFKFGIFDQELNLKGLGRIAVQTDTGKGDLCELLSERFIKSIKEGIDHACKQADIPAENISGIGYSSQANSFILLDKNDKALTPLVLWPDTRAKDFYPRVVKLFNDNDFLKTTAMGIEPSPQLCINKLLWFKESKSQIWKNVGSILTISDYLVYLFTGRKAGDMGTASLLGLMDCRSGRWWDKAFDILNIDKSLFSPRLRIGSQAETTNSFIADQTGVKIGTPFYIGSLDHHMAALGAGLPDGADISESTGTVLACVNFTENYRPQKDICISPWMDNKYAKLAFDGNGAGCLQWYQKNFAEEYSLTELVQMAQEAGSAAGLKAKPMSFNYSSLAEVIENIDNKHTHGHFIFAFMESTANTLNELINKLACNGKTKKVAATGGGAMSDLWLKIKAQITGCEFVRVDCSEPAARGAAMIVHT